MMSNEIRLSVRARAGGCIVSADEFVLFEISNSIPEAEHHSLGVFHIALCRTGNSAELQSFALKLRGEDRNSLGYCFPVSAFGNAEAFDTRWAAVYGSAAFRFLTQAQMLRSVLSDDVLGLLRGQEVGIHDIYDDDLSVLVLGREALDRFEVSDSQIPLMLAREGICVTDEDDDGTYPPIFKPWQPAISVARMSEEFRNEEELFWRLIRMAARSGWETGSFLILYQCLEYSIQRVFDWGMVNISPQGISTWDLKDRLSKLTNEKFRLNILNNHCFGGRVDAGILEALRGECRAVLAALGDDVAAHTSWTGALYALRNLVIHNQVRLMRRTDLSLKEVNIALTRLCLEIIGSLAAPGEGGIWTNEGMVPETASQSSAYPSEP